jgi:peroxin-1
LPLPFPEGDLSNRQFYKASFRRLRPPVNPTETPADESKPSSPPVPRVLNAGGGAGEEGKAADDKVPKNVHEAFVGWAEGVPEGHIVFPSMIKGVDEWDLVWYVIFGHLNMFFCLMLPLLVHS